MSLPDQNLGTAPTGRQPMSPEAPGGISAQAWAHAADQAVADTLPAIAGGLAALFIVFAFAHFLLLPAPANQVMAITAALSTLACAGLYVALSRRKLPEGWSHPVGFLYIAIILANVILQMYLMRDPGLTINLVLLIAALGFFLLATNWLVFSLIIVLAAWASMIILIPSAQWGFLLFAIVTALVLAVLAHVARLSALRKLELTRVQKNYFRTELETVLTTTEEAQRSLATSMAVGQRITSILDLDTLLTQVAILIQQRFNLYAVSIFLMDATQETIILHGGTGKNGRQLNVIDPANQSNFRLKVSDEKGIVGWVAARRRSLNIEDVTKDQRYIAVDWLNETRSELALPLEFGTHMLGVLDLQSAKAAAFHDENVPFLQLLADQVATAINNASLYDQIRRFNADLENLVDQRTEDLHKTYEQLERLDRAKSDFIGVASHELRTPLTVVQGYSQMLLDEPVIKAEDRYNLLVKGILSGVQRLLEIIESMLDVAKIDNRELMLYPTPVPVPTLISTVIETIFSTPNERQVQVVQDTTGLPSIQADVDGLRKVFRHLILNAIKFTPDGHTVTIRGREMPTGAFDINTPTVEIVVEDTGIGIDPTNHELIFNKFYSTERISLHSTGKIKYKGKGPGLGLSIAKGIIEAHGGKIWVESPGHDEETFPGSQFHVVLPIRQ